MKNIQELVQELAQKAEIIVLKKNSDYDYSEDFIRYSSIIKGFSIAIDKSDMIKFENTLAKYGLDETSMRYILRLELSDRIEQAEYYKNLYI